MSGLALEAALLALVLTVVCWSATALAVASRTGRPLLWSAALGALVPGAGALVVLALPRRRPAPGPRRLPVAALALLPLGLAAVALLLACLRQPWLLVRAERLLDEQVRGASTPFTAVPVLLAVAVLVVCLVGFALRPAARWLLPVLFTGAAAVLVAGFLLLTSDAAGPLVRRISVLARSDSAVRSGSGARLLLLGGLLATAWSLAGLAVLLRSRSGAAAGGPAAPRLSEAPVGPDLPTWLAPPDPHAGLPSSAWEPPPAPTSVPHPTPDGGVRR